MVLEIPGGIFGQQDVRETAGIEADFTNTQHNHSNAAGGGNVTGSHTNLADIGTHTHTEIDSHLNGTDQTNIRVFLVASVDNTFETIYTVTAGKTFFLTDIIFGSNDSSGDDGFLGIGGTDIMKFNAGATSGITTGTSNHMSFTTPLLFTSETVIQHKAQDADQNYITILGYEK